MKLAAIDIGSNAIRMQIVKVFEEDQMVSFKKLEYLRFPLRLGHDVFKKKEIQPATKEKFVKLMQAFKLLIDLYEVSGYQAVATSAMREAQNGDKVRDDIFDKTGLHIQIIEGEEEARILNLAIIPYLEMGTYVHIDVGGGSTEINIFKDRALKQGKSFKIGSVRKLSAKDRTKVFKDIKDWILDSIDNNSNRIMGVGTGGNINRLFKLSHRVNGKTISLVELKAIRAYVSSFSLAQRMSILKLNPDRADVIVPASDIYIKVMEMIKCNQILVPRVGLKDGLIYKQFDEITDRPLSQFEFLEEF